MSNPYCESLQIAVPVVDQVVQRRLVTGGKPSLFMLLVATLDLIAFQLGLRPPRGRPQPTPVHPPLPPPDGWPFLDLAVVERAGEDPAYSEDRADAAWAASVLALLGRLSARSTTKARSRPPAPGSPRVAEVQALPPVSQPFSW